MCDAALRSTRICTNECGRRDRSVVGRGAHEPSSVPEGVPPLLAALASGDDEAVPTLAAAVPEEAWPALLETIRRHGLTPLLSDLLDPAADACPVNVLRALRTHRDLAMLWHRIQMTDLSAILMVLCQAGIPHILLKGTALGLMVYRKPWQRLVGDTDLLVPAAQVREAHDRVRSLGFQVMEEWREAHHLPALRKGNHPPVEIHHESLYIPAPEPGYTLVPVDFGLLRSEAHAVDAGGFDACVPSPRDALLQLSCNFASHMEESVARPLRWVRDYAELLRPGRVTWEGLSERLTAIAPELTDTVVVSLALAQPFLDHLYNDGMRDAIARLPRRLGRMARVVRPRDMVYEWVTSPGRAWSVLSCLIGPWRATRWSVAKLLVDADHISRQTGIPRTSLTMRVYPVAFMVHAAYHMRRKDRSRPV